MAWPRIEKGAGLASYARRTVINIAIDRARKKSSSELPDSALDGERPAAADEIDGIADPSAAILGPDFRATDHGRCVALTALCAMSRRRSFVTSAVTPPA